MRATGAYIASAGTAVVMLAASLATLALVSTLVAFGAWPATGARSQVNEVLVSDLAKAKPKPIPVRADAVQVVGRAHAARHGAAGPGHARATSAGVVSRSRNGTPTADAAPRSAPAPASARTPAAAPPVSSPAGSVTQGAQQVAQNVDRTTQKLAGQVTQPVQNAADQVGGVVNQVTTPVQQTTPPVGQQVQDTAGSVLPH
jgi:hypothetical protein